MRLLMLGIVALVATQVVAEDRLSIARNGQSDYCIVLPGSADPVERSAAAELRDFLRQVTGAELPVVEMAAAGTRPKLWIGARQLPSPQPDLGLKQLGPDGVLIRTIGRDVILAGSSPRGTLYAVYTLLEDYVGCRWWTASESSIPRKPTLDLPTIDLRYTPKLRYREAFYRDAFDGRLAARLKLNGQHHNVPAELGGHYRFAGFVHTFYPLLPPEKYFAEHPDWYSEIRGKRTHDRAQLCLTNDAMRMELTRNAMARLRKDPGVGLISISQNDWHGQCECAKCKAVEAEEKSPAGPLIRFVNAVATEIEREFPDVLVETLAYQYTRQPPAQARPRRNVIVRLCSIECSFVQPLATGPQNEKFKADIEGWSRIAPQLFVWDYVTNFSNYILPHPNLRILAPNIRFFTDHRVVGLFEQGDAGSAVGDFVRMRAWVLAHLMWNPQRDEKALVREFLQGYYGPAAPHLDAYLNVLHDAADRSGVYLKCYMDSTAPWLPPEKLDEATRLYDAATKAVAGDPILAARVRRERLPLDHAWLQRWSVMQRRSQLQNIPFAGPRDPQAACEEFISLANQWKANQYREAQPFGPYAEKLRRRFRAPASPPTGLAGQPADRWIDLQDNVFRMAREGEWAKCVADAAASDGYAARMPGNHRQWAVSAPLGEEFDGQRKWRCYVVARAEGKASAGPAMTMGIYDATEKKSVAHHAAAADKAIGPQYRTFDLGAHRLRQGMYFWVAPPERPGEIDAVYVDRIYLVAE